MSLEASNADGGEGTAACANSSLPVELSTPLAVSLMLQCAIYGALGAAEMRSLLERPMTSSDMIKFHPLLQHSMITVTSTTTSAAAASSLSSSAAVPELLENSGQAAKVENKKVQ